MVNTSYKDWGEVSDMFDIIKSDSLNKDLSNESEAQTRFDIIDRIVREILQWQHGQISVEPRTIGQRTGWIDYILISGDAKIIIEAKKIGASFPDPTTKKKLKLTGSTLSEGEAGDAIRQAEDYAVQENANVAIITNGKCWMYYPVSDDIIRENIYVNVIYPFEDIEDAKLLFNLFACHNVENQSLNQISTDTPYIIINKLLNIVKDKDARTDRNNIADFVTSALDNAIRGEAIIEDINKLEYCYVSTEARTRFDNTLNMHLISEKPISVLPAKRLKRSKVNNELNNIIINSEPTSTPPVTILIGQVGAGKSTYIKHFELIQGANALSSKKCHWVYVDFERMGKTGDPRKFIYQSLLDYLSEEHPLNPTDWQHAIEPAYRKEIESLKAGPFHILSRDKTKFESMIQDRIVKDYEDKEPYVEKVFRYISEKSLCVIVLDNVDLYEDEDLETKVLSEGIAFSKKIKCYTIVSIRDTTFVRHRNNSIFDAHELKKLWLDPPPFREVLSKRLSYAKSVLKNKEATINTDNNMKLYVPDLSIFFDIVQSSLLSEKSGKFIESISESNIRKGIKLATNFITSGHIQADRALRNYMNSMVIRSLPYHEVFKGSVLGQWKHFKESRAECINLFDSSFGSKKILLLRLYTIRYLLLMARDKSTVEVQVSDLIGTISKFGASSNHILLMLNQLYQDRIIKSKNSQEIKLDSTVYLTVAGGYYMVFLTKQIVYVESVMIDTTIFDSNFWTTLSEVTKEIDHEHSTIKRLEKRGERMVVFLQYLSSIEESMFTGLDTIAYLKCIDEINISLKKGFNNALKDARKHYEVDEINL